MNEIEQKFKKLGIELPEAAKPLGNFLPYLLEGSNLYISGQISIDKNGNIIQGKLGESIDLTKGQEAARYCAIGLLARAKAAISNLNRIEKLVKLGAFINFSPYFTEHPKVANGASDFMVEVLGKKKGHMFGLL